MPSREPHSQDLDARELYRRTAKAHGFQAVTPWDELPAATREYWVKEVSGLLGNGARDKLVDDLVSWLKCGKQPDQVAWRSPQARRVADEIMREFRGYVRQRDEAYAIAEKAIQDEPEFTDEMPDEMFEAIRNDRDALTFALRHAVASTKAAILARLQQALGVVAPPEKQADGNDMQRPGYSIRIR